MILNKTPITLAEVKEIVEKEEDKEELKRYLKKFSKLKKDKAEALVKELKELDNVKLNENSIIKIADLLPKDKEDLNKIVLDAALSEEETNAILEITNKY